MEQLNGEEPEPFKMWAHGWALLLYSYCRCCTYTTPVSMDKNPSMLCCLGLTEREQKGTNISGTQDVTEWPIPSHIEWCCPERVEVPLSLSVCVTLTPITNPNLSLSSFMKHIWEGLYFHSPCGHFQVLLFTSLYALTPFVTCSTYKHKSV